MLKGPIHYQSVIRTPLIWSDPAAASAAGTRNQTLTGTLDLARTVLDRAGVVPANGMQGRSLLPVLQGRATTHHDVVMVEEEVQRTYLGFDRPVRMRTLVTARYRFSVYLGATWGELYALEDDPHEMRNLWADPAHGELRARLFETLAQCMLDATDRSRLPTHLA
jgi:arylsulfatase A-like enzyme